MKAPRGLEILVKKAAVDADFKNQLLSKREAFAREHSIPLDPTEESMLASTSEEQLKNMIEHTTVPETQRSYLMKASIVAIVALIAQLNVSPANADSLQPTEKMTAWSQNYDGYNIRRGIAPDMPVLEAEEQVFELKDSESDPLYAKKEHLREILTDLLEKMNSPEKYELEADPEDIAQLIQSSSNLLNKFGKVQQAVEENKQPDIIFDKLPEATDSVRGIRIDIPRIIVPDKED